MSVDDVLTLLDHVRPTSNGWSARCPAHHPDRHPSLTVKEGDKGLLVKCWSGCDLEAICAAVHIRVADLFYKTTRDRRTIRAERLVRQTRQRGRAVAWRQAMRGARLAHDAQQLIEAARGLDIAAWTEAELDDALNAVADAWDILLEERDVAA